MLIEQKLRSFLELVGASTKEELIWMNGYLSGMVSTQPAAASPSTTKIAGKITIAYGTETGHSKKLAAAFAARAKQQGVQAKLVSLDQYRPADLAKEDYFVTILSTHGDGEPPAAAKKFYDHIHNNGFRLEQLKYGVLALGDTAYPLFCKAGEDVDAQLHKLGGKRLVSLQKCDTDYEADANEWFNAVLQQLSAVPAHSVAMKKTAGKMIYEGKITSNINLNDHGSAKQTHHIEIAAEGVQYEPGDSIGIVPENADHLVEAIISLSGAAADWTIEHKTGTASLAHLLKKKVGIVYLPERVIRQYAAIVQQQIPDTRMGLHELLKIYPLSNAGQLQEVVKILEPITPRLYSISSSLQSHRDEVHVTVARDKFMVNDSLKFGLCSDYLSCLPPGTGIRFYVHKNEAFRLPAAEKDVIMIGPGTGIAPFRAFLQEREATGAAGRNWLFFGDQHFVTDFLYQTEIQSWKEAGLLARVNLAFSRDQPQKIYVQHKMEQYGEALFDWLQRGAHVYVCGSKDPMSIDVENTLLNIISRHGNLTPPDATSYLDSLKENGRYLKDVY